MRFLRYALALAIPAALPGCAPPARDAGPASTAALASVAPDRYLARGNVRIRYQDRGRGQPIVLLHGYTDRIEMWGAVAESLATAHRVVVPDLRGFGHSSKPRAPGSYGREMTDDVVALLDSLGLARAHVVGYSMGALITADLAVRHRNRIATATLVAGPFYRDSAEFARTVAPFVADLEGGEGLLDFFRFILPTWQDSALLPVVRQIEREHELPSLIGTLREMGGLVHPASRLGTLDVPAVAIVGRNDPMLGPTRWIASQWPGIQLLELDDADHAVVFGVPEVVTAVRQLITTPVVAIGGRPNGGVL